MSLNPSSYSACLWTPKYGYLRLRCHVEGFKDVIVHNVYRTQDFFPTSSQNQPLDKPLSLDSHGIFSFVSVALSDAFTNHVLLGDFNIHHHIFGGPQSYTSSCFTAAFVPPRAAQPLSTATPREHYYRKGRLRENN
jgi:hypothetical protein